LPCILPAGEGAGAQRSSGGPAATVRRASLQTHRPLPERSADGAAGRACAQVGVRCVRLEGSMSMDARDRMIDAFTNDPAVTVFLMSLKAGGVALNLTAASHVMLLDPWWCGPYPTPNLLLS